MGKVKAHELRQKNAEELSAQLTQLKQDLAQLRVQQVSAQGGASKLSQIKVVRKAIARVLTVQTAKNREAVKKTVRNKKFKPIDIRQKKTRAIRRALTSSEKSVKTLRQIKRASYFPRNRKIALKA